MVDISIMGALLLIGEFLRAKVKLIQKVLIPPAVIAGFLALLFGPQSPVEQLKILPLSTSFGTYASVLIVVIFACHPHRGPSPRKGPRRAPRSAVCSLTCRVLPYCSTP